MAKKKTIRTIPQERTPMREQDPSARAKNFEEVACGYDVGEALREAERCLLCPDQPCVSGCPVGIDIPGFIRKIGEQDFRAAYDVIAQTNLLAAVCGRVCPQESQCEGVCTVGETLEAVAIGRLERWVGDLAIREGWSTCRTSSPTAFASASSARARRAWPARRTWPRPAARSRCYEAFHQPGGVLKYGIPDFRLPNSRWSTPRSRN
jgi:glutamate synthase (NADPH) small chain